MIDLGPEGGEAGGRVVFEGTPEALVARGLRAHRALPARRPAAGRGRDGLSTKHEAHPGRSGIIRSVMSIQRSWAYRAGLRCLVPAFLLAFVAAPSARAEESFEDLLANLKSPTARTRQSAAEALGKTRRREAVAPLSALVRDPEPRVRLAVVDALRALRDTSGVPALVTSLQDGDPGIRDEAISAIVEIYGDRERGGPIDRFLETFSDEYDRTSIAPYTAVDPAAFHGLAGALRDEEKSVRVDAAYAIGILGGSSVVARPRGRAPGPGAGRARGGRHRARQGRHGRGGQGAHPAPRRRVDERAQPRDGRRSACCACATPGPRCARCSSRTAGASWARACSPSLSRIGDPAQADLFRELLTSNDPEQRRLAVEGLGRVADASMLVGVQDRLPAREERRRAHGLQLLAGARSATVRSSTASRSGSAPGACARRRARAATCSSSAPGVAPDLYPLPQRSRTPRCAGASPTCSRSWATRRRSPRLQPLLNDPNSKVADRANRAIQRAPAGWDRARRPSRERGRRPLVAVALVGVAAGVACRRAGLAAARSDAARGPLGLVDERRYDEAIAAVGDASDADSLYVLGRAWAGKAATAPGAHARAGAVAAAAARPRSCARWASSSGRWRRGPTTPARSSRSRDLLAPHALARVEAERQRPKGGSFAPPPGPDASPERVLRSYADAMQADPAGHRGGRAPGPVRDERRPLGRGRRGVPGAGAPPARGPGAARPLRRLPRRRRAPTPRARSLSTRRRSCGVPTTGRRGSRWPTSTCARPRPTSASASTPPPSSGSATRSS